MKISQPIRFGLAGYGAWGKYHAEAIRSTPDCALTAICAATAASREAAANQTGARVFSSLQELLAKADVDVIDIVAPNHLHEEMACAAFGRDKHVLLEKPMATSIAACDRIIAASDAARKILLVGHEMRFSGLHGEVRRILAGGRLGDLRYVIIDLWRRPYRKGADGWRMDPKRVGNWILEEPVHYFDLASWYLDGCGPPATMFAYGNTMDTTRAHNFDADDNFTAIFTYPNGAYAVVSHSLAAVEHHLSIKLFGTKALIRAEWHAELDRSEKPAFALTISEDGSMRPLEAPTTPGETFELRQEIAAMVAAIRHQSPLPITPAEGRRAVMLCVEARRSLELRQPVTLL
jgi:myo-inositol 2-dehydrogenase/D-chiro-inositol 1-dehydrogenase